MYVITNCGIRFQEFCFRLACPNGATDGAVTATLPEHLSSPLGFSVVHFVRSLVFCVMLCRSFVLLSFFFWSLVCLSFFELRFLITSLWYLQTFLVKHTISATIFFLERCHNICIQLIFWELWYFKCWLSNFNYISEISVIQIPIKHICRCIQGRLSSILGPQAEQCTTYTTTHRN